MLTIIRKAFWWYFEFVKRKEVKRKSKKGEFAVLIKALFIHMKHKTHPSGATHVHNPLPLPNLIQPNYPCSNHQKPCYTCQTGQPSKDRGNAEARKAKRPARLLYSKTRRRS